MKIKGFPGYTYIDNIMYNPKGNEQKKLTNSRGNETYRIKNYKNEWTHLARKKLLSLVGEILILPKDAKEIPGHDKYYVDKKGTIYSFSRTYPAGKILTPRKRKNGYPAVNISKKTIDVHTLVAKTFIMDDYSTKGLCCLHKDNNKNNSSLDNLCIGTYSRNNKDAYRDDMNKGNKSGINRKVV